MKQAVLLLCVSEAIQYYFGQKYRTFLCLKVRKGLLEVFFNMIFLDVGRLEAFFNFEMAAADSLVALLPSFISVAYAVDL